MGYTTLDAALGFTSSSNSSDSSNLLPPPCTHILITDTIHAEGNFLLHHFILNNVKAGKHVLVVGFAQVLAHYIAIGRKLVRSIAFLKSYGRFFTDNL